MIEEAYISFEVAKLLKEKRFDEKCDYLYDDNGTKGCFGKGKGRLVAFSNNRNSYHHADFLYSAPTQQMACRWLREVHDIHFDITPLAWVYPETIEHLTGWGW